VEEWIDLREGDALETLNDLTLPVDLLLNDGFPRFALPVLQLLHPLLRPGAVVLCGNAALFPADHREYLQWVRDPRNGYRSAALGLKLAGEMSVRAASFSPHPEDAERVAADQLAFARSARA
jgi:predicted O-methyltransferase YrrM